MSSTGKQLTYEQTECLANELMQRYGLLDDGWAFEWTRGKKRLGETAVGSRRNRRTGKTERVKLIRLSRYLVEMNSEPVIRDTILHEIAHALAGIEHGHDEVWKAMCRKVGAKPERLADKSVKIVDHAYSIVCDLCTKELAKRHRRPAESRLNRSHCEFCGPKSIGKLSVVQLESAS